MLTNQKNWRQQLQSIDQFTSHPSMMPKGLAGDLNTSYWEYNNRIFKGNFKKGTKGKLLAKMTHLQKPYHLPKPVYYEMSTFEPGLSISPQQITLKPVENNKSFRVKKRQEYFNRDNTQKLSNIINNFSVEPCETFYRTSKEKKKKAANKSEVLLRNDFSPKKGGSKFQQLKMLLNLCDLYTMNESLQFLNSNNYRYCKLNLKQLKQNKSSQLMDKRNIVILDYKLLEKPFSREQIEAFQLLRAQFILVLIVDCYYDNVVMINYDGAIIFDSVFMVRMTKWGLDNILLHLIDYTPILQLYNEFHREVFIFKYLSREADCPLTMDNFIRKIPVFFMNDFKCSIVFGQSMVDVIDVLLYLKYDILFDRRNSLMRLQNNILDNIIQQANIRQQKEEYLKECFIQMKQVKSKGQIQEFQEVEDYMVQAKNKIIKTIRTQSDEKIYQLNFTVGDMFQRNLPLFKNFKSLQVTIPKFQLVIKNQIQIQTLLDLYSIYTI